MLRLFHIEEKDLDEGHNTGDGEKIRDLGIYGFLLGTSPCSVMYTCLDNFFFRPFK